MIIAHVAGLPLEEIAPTILAPALLLARAWLMPRVRRRDGPDPK